MPDEIWRFTYMGERTHFLFHANENVARCGVGVIVNNEWRGTGSQEEYDLAASMPKCKNCLRLLVRKPKPQPPKKPKAIRGERGRYTSAV